MSNTTSPRHNSGFHYRLRFFHRCRSPISQCCDPGQIDRFQIQGSAIESTCGSPIVVALIRYKHDSESGLSQECQRAQFAPGAASFAIKAIVVPSDQVLSYMDQPLLQQPRLVDSKGRNIIEGPDVSPDGCIYATPLEKNGIAHLNNFCIMHEYTGGQVPAAVSGNSYSIGHQPPGPMSKRKTSGSGGGRSKQHSPTPTRRVRGMLKSNSDAARLHGATEILQDSADVLQSNVELCLLVQLLRRDAQRPGRWFAYHMPHLISRPFQVIPRRGLLPSVQSSPAPLCFANTPPLMGTVMDVAQQQLQLRQQKLEQEQQIPQLLTVPGREFLLPRHSVEASGFLGASEPQLLVQPHRFMSPQYKRHMDGSTATMDFDGAIATSDLAVYGISGPMGLLPGDDMGLTGTPFPIIKQQPSQQLELPTGFVFGCSEPTIGLSSAKSVDRLGMGGGGLCTSGTVLGARSMVGPLTGRGGSAGGAGGMAVGVGSFGAEAGLSSLSADSPSGAGSHRGLRARRRSLLSKDSSHDDSSVGGAPMSASGTTAAGVASLRTPSVTSAMNPTANGLRAAALTMAATASMGPSPPYSPQQRMVHTVSLGSAMEMERDQSSQRRSDEGRSLPLPLQLRQAPSAALLDLNISDLLEDIQMQPLLTSDMMDLEEGAAKRVRSNTTTTSDVAAFASDNNTNSNSGQIFGSSNGGLMLSTTEGNLSLGGGTCGGVDGGCAEPSSDQAAFKAQLARSDCWTMEMHFEQMMNLRKQSTGLSGTHASIEYDNGNSAVPVACASAGATAVAAAVAALGVCDVAGAAVATAGGGSNSRGSSASQLDLLIQMLTHQEGMEDEEQELLRPHHQPLQQELQDFADAIQVPTCGGADEMQI
ncbi:hypothetical protein Vretimale_6710 [Volvox reticuliferus]|uniref:Uncharacterized protein n=1 Tax=Volvox reticuliferus TaxID=1737510 RepID=A0A8J4LLG0_9CHLO|nr:hypothetical protein Vretifemale_7239 [Volvox reticuliferus]GIM01948.1 hypothetical protein Vretimale_6710 [Volvox reticuliferus]